MIPFLKPEDKYTKILVTLCFIFKFVTSFIASNPDYKKEAGEIGSEEGSIEE